MVPQEPDSDTNGGPTRRKGQFEPEPFGKYFLLDRVAIGGMAEIFRARTYGHGGFEKELVIKRILGHLTDDSEFVTMFIEEAKLTVQLQHPNVVQVYDFGKIRENYFLAMEGVYGKDLKTISQKVADKRQQLPLQFSAFMAHEAAKGLYYAHNKKDEKGLDINIVHRDISPTNVIVGFDGQVKLLDFGIAKAENSAIRDTEGVLKGKFEYMSPEQAQGKIVDHRSDIFSLGICLWEMITQRRLFKSEKKLETLERIRNCDIPQVRVVNPEVPVPLEHIVNKALAKEPRDRYQDAEQMRHELEEYLKPTGINELTLDVSDWMQDLFILEMEQERLRLEAAREQAAALASMEDNLDLDAGMDMEYDDDLGLDFDSEDELDTIESEDGEDDVGPVAGPTTTAAPVEEPKRKIPGLLWVGLFLFILGGLGGGIALIAMMTGETTDPVTDTDSDTTPQFGILDLRITPAEAARGATILLNEEAIEVPFNELQPDTQYKLVVKKEGFVSFEDAFKVAAGERYRMNAQLQPEEQEPVTATVEKQTPKEPPTPTVEKPAIIWRSSPSGASVNVDGRKIGTTPYRWEGGSAGRSYSATMSKSGYEDGSASATFPSNGSVTANGTLAKLPDKSEPGYLTINARPWAEVYVDGVKVGNTPIGRHQVEPGSHTVRLVCPPLDAERTISVTVGAGETKPVSADLEE